MTTFPLAYSGLPDLPVIKRDNMLVLRSHPTGKARLFSKQDKPEQCGWGEADSATHIGGCVMPDNTAKVPGKAEKTPPSTLQPWRPFESLRREVDRLFDDFSGGIWRSPFGRSFFDVEPFRRAQASLGAMPAVDVTQLIKAMRSRPNCRGWKRRILT